MRVVTAIRYVHFEDLGIFEDVLAARGIAVRYVEAGVDDLKEIPDSGGDLLVVLGGPIGAYQEDKYPFLADELRIIESRLAHNLPIVGICLGAQLMARALGARVYAAPAKEIGWAPISLTADGLRSPIRHLAHPETSVLHWHGDTFDLPLDATLLASTNVYVNQAYSVGSAALALQFHPELKATNIERWLIGHACELSAPSMPDLGRLRKDTIKYGLHLQGAATAFFREWLEDTGI
jgi:GMP synthase (glutamine-hydrolysing)